ncbi:Planctomycete cytochrome C [Stieleria bergensis]|uniref:Planctomycete cytochrome C n=1 Tax=Stieleria bergensis TaxID=2528025 RepID=A0A517T2D1_9BACT|nr:Planctomycete cytochrome C [Planctomycetes bacterium SV_7m_r]
MNTKTAFPLVCLFLLVAAERLHADDPYSPVQPFLNRYCVACHGATKQKGEVRLDDFAQIDGALWSDLYDQIHDASMPPEDARQPSSNERASIAQLVLQISRDEAFSIPTGYRRLNRREFRNTVRDLLGLKPGIYDPAGRVFKDEVDHGFDTNADELVISNELLLEYLESAEHSLRMALFLTDLQPPVTKVVAFKPGKLQSGDRRFTTNKKHSTVLRGSGQYSASESPRGVAISGYYRITVHAAGVDRNHYGNMKFPPVSGPIKMGIGTRLDSEGKQSTSNLAKSFDLLDDQFEVYSTVVWLEKGAYPWVGFLNGAGKPASSIRQAIRQRKVDPKEISPENYNGPGVEVTRFSLEGPLDPQWPPPTYRTIFQTDEMPDFEKAEVRAQLMQRFLTRAFRRPATDQDVRDYLDYLDQQYQRTSDWQEAFIKTFAAAMASHDFLYIKEEIGQLPPLELASRLSYFLWSTMPDAELFQLARSGRLLDADVYSAQVERMLGDPRTDEFVHGFATQWLSLDLLGTMPPDIKDRRYSAYHKQNYETAFRNETLHFFRHVLFENQPVGDFLDSDYSIINDTLANVYNLPFDGGSEFQRVSLPKASLRGGLLGHGSILALTSNGVETLPVTRGHWILDELLGTPPPAPPEEVPALVPDLNGVDTPRDQLVRHRRDPACFECHKRMDPLGLALENFDVIGRYRAAYETGATIDPAGQIFGTKFQNVTELRKLLRTQQDPFAKSLIIKLAEYAKGRRLNRRDLEIVDQVAAKSKQDEHRFQSMLRHLLASELLLHR